MNLIGCLRDASDQLRVKEQRGKGATTLKNVTLIIYQHLFSQDFPEYFLVITKLF